MVKKLYKHQRLMLSYSFTEQHPALFVEMRLGKTLVSLRRMKAYSPRNPGSGGRKVLVVLPQSAFQGWITDGAEEGWGAVELVGNRKQKQKALILGLEMKSKVGVLFLLNKEGWQALPEITEIPWDVVVADESHFLKNPTAKVTKFYCKNFRSIPHRWILTGTPCPEGEHEYFSQLCFLRGGAFGFRSFWDFRMHYMRPHPAGFGWVLKPGAPDHLRRVVGGTCCVLRRKDVGMERKKMYEQRTLQFPKEIQKIYDEAETRFILGKPGEDSKESKALHDPEDLVADSTSTKWVTSVYIWLRRLCGGFLGDDLAWPGKLNELLDLLKGELKGEQTVVWCFFNNEVHAIRKMLQKNRISSTGWTGEDIPQERRARQKEFQAGKHQVLVIQQATAQVGMDLSAADTAIYYSSPPGQIARRQTEDRILSLRKKTPLLYIDLVVPSSVDSDVLAQLQQKKILSDLSLSRALLHAMRTRKIKELPT